MKKKLNIAFFTDTYLPNTDGVVKSIVLAKKYLEKKGHKVYVFAPSPTGKSYSSKDIYYFTSAEFPPYPMYRVSFPNYFKLERIFRELKINIIHNHGVAFTSIASVLLAKKLGIPSVSTFHTNITKATHYLIANELLEKTTEKIAWQYLKFLYSNFDAITAPSKTTANILKENGIKSIFLPNGIELEQFYKISRKPKENCIIHVGRLVKEKHIDFIFPFLKKTNVKLKVIGDGPAINYYRKKAAELKVRDKVEFLGFVPNKELAKHYKDAQALVFTSLFDTQGLVVIEALASGIPILARKNSAACEIASSMETCFSDFKTFKSALAKSKRITSKKCRGFSKNYDVKKTTEALERIYFSII